MSLDLSAVIKQIIEMVANLKSGQEDRRAKINRAVENLHAQSNNLDKLKKKIALSRTTWLVAEPVEQLDLRHSPKPSPSEFTVLATDGSHIDVDRHQSTRCYLINTSSILLKYGSKPDAILESEPRVYSSDDDLWISSPDKLREIPIEGALLGIKRTVAECEKLAQMAEKLPSRSTTLGLIDGTLILWTLEGHPDFVIESMCDRGFLAYLETMRKLNKERQFAVAAYISYPRSADVVNALRVALCPKDFVDSDKCPACTGRECYALAGVNDREMFDNILETGERSAIFISPSKIQKRYGPHQVHFFYLKMDEEIARIEVPAWVAKDEKLLDLTHSLTLDQCRRGQGYPVALSEAHEKAVVTGADRENFWQLVEESLVVGHVSSGGSAKSRSKRARSV